MRTRITLVAGAIAFFVALIAGDALLVDIHLAPLGGIALVLLSFVLDSLWVLVPLALVVALLFGYVDFSPALGSRISMRSFPIDATTIAAQYAALVVIVHYLKARISENATLGAALEHSVGLLDYHRSRADRDVLSGLYARAFFEQRLPVAIERARAAEESLAIVFGDLNAFKSINDTYGHSAGDEVLRFAAERIRSAIRGNDIAARWGGDEFAVLLEGLHSRDQAAQVVSKIGAAFNDAFVMIGESKVKVGISLGIAIFPGDANGAAGLMAHADRVMYRQKELARGGGDVH